MEEKLAHTYTSIKCLILQIPEAMNNSWDKQQTNRKVKKKKKKKAEE